MLRRYPLVVFALFLAAHFAARAAAEQPTVDPARPAEIQLAETDPVDLDALERLQAEKAAQASKVKSDKAKSDDSEQEDSAANRKNISVLGGDIHALPGFKVEMLYSVPLKSQGSWVAMTVDPRGRLIVSDQYGGLYRLTLPAPDSDDKVQVESIDLKIGEAQGLLWAFDSLYVVVNAAKHFRSGLYRVRDTDEDDKLDKVELLRALDGENEHGPHAVALGPDHKSLFVVAGNATQMPELNGTDVPRVWGEENLLPHLPDGAGFMTSEKAPGGFICQVSPDGSQWQLYAIGMRNAYDIAFNRDTELFTFDSDMEWDYNLPWYRPTRALHIVNGGDYGYRGGSSKFPPHFFDSLPPVSNIGPGSPTGITFGYDAKFPAKYQDALFLSDWSYGKIYALHMQAKGSSYEGNFEEFIAGTPLAVTDIVINPHDGAMYFLVGGRKTQSALYRVTYNGDEPTAKVEAQDVPEEVAARVARRELEHFHGRRDRHALDKAWPQLGSSDRFIRWAARTAIEFQPLDTWRDRALRESSSPLATLEALLALAQVGSVDPEHRTKDDPPADGALRDQILAALARIPWDQLDPHTELALLRVYQVVLNRFGTPGDADRELLIARLDARFPARSHEANMMLAPLMVALEAPSAAEKTMRLLQASITQQEQIDYATALRVLKTGWTPELRRAYAEWFVTAADYKGGNSFRGFMNQIRRDVLANLSDAERAELKPLIETKPSKSKAPAAARSFVREWKLDELVDLVSPTSLVHRDFDRGRNLFAAANCFACHRFADEGGGLGPDLSGVAGRFSPSDLLESIVLPSKVISDQYAGVTFSTTDGRIITGRVVNFEGKHLMISPDMLDPAKTIRLNREDIDGEILKSPVSMMPEGLLNTLNGDEVLDLMAYILSRGDRRNAMFAAP